MSDKQLKPKDKNKTSNIVLLVLGVFLLVFIIAMIVIYCVFQSVPDTLIQCVLGAGGIEAFALAAIKVSKVIKGEKITTEGEDLSGEDY